MHIGTSRCMDDPNLNFWSHRQRRTWHYYILHYIILLLYSFICAICALFICVFDGLGTSRANNRPWHGFTKLLCILIFFRKYRVVTSNGSETPQWFREETQFFLACIYYTFLIWVSTFFKGSKNFPFILI